MDESELFVGEEGEVDAPKANLGLLQLFGLTSAFLGIFFAYALQGVVIVPLLQGLGLDPAVVSYVMLVSPTAVVVAFPVVGALSDQWSGRWGRRRPFIVLGCLLQVIGLALLSAAPDLGHLLGDALPTMVSSEDDDSSASQVVRWWAIGISIPAYALVDGAAALMQLPTRAMLMDVASPAQQVTGCALLAFFMSAGNALGYLAAAVPWHTLPLLSHIQTPPCSDACTDYRVVFLIAIVFDLCTTATACFSVHEIPLILSHGVNDSDEEESRVASTWKKMSGPLVNTWSYLRNMPKRTRRVLLVYTVSWLVWPLFVFYISNWVGEEVYGGDPHAAVGSSARDAFDQGVEAASVGLFFYSIVSFLYSLCIPKITKTIGVRLAWSLPQLMHGILFVLFIIIRNKIATILMIALVGVNLATMHVIPFVLVGEETQESERGIAISIINVCNASPSLLFNAIINPLLLTLFTSLVPEMVYGAIVMSLAGLLVFLIPMKPQAMCVAAECQGSTPPEDHHTS